MVTIDGCEEERPANEPCDLKVQLDASAARKVGSEQLRVSFDYQSVNNPDAGGQSGFFEIQLSADVFEPEQISFSLTPDPDSVNFGSVLVGAVSPPS